MNKYCPVYFIRMPLIMIEREKGRKKNEGCVDEVNKTPIPGNKCIYIYIDISESDI